jgi:L-arabinose isomerase
MEFQFVLAHGAEEFHNIFSRARCQNSKICRLSQQNKGE